jgi:hypothetical protein
MLVFKDICTGEMLPDVLEGTSGDFMWGADDSCIYYSTTDTEQRSPMTIVERIRLLNGSIAGPASFGYTSWESRRAWICVYTKN